MHTKFHSRCSFAFFGEEFKSSTSVKRKRNLLNVTIYWSISRVSFRSVMRTRNFFLCIIFVCSSYNETSYLIFFLHARHHQSISNKVALPKKKKIINIEQQKLVKEEEVNYFHLQHQSTGERWDKRKRNGRGTQKKKSSCRSEKANDIFDRPVRVFHSAKPEN